MRVQLKMKKFYGNNIFTTEKLKIIFKLINCDKISPL